MSTEIKENIKELAADLKKGMKLDTTSGSIETDKDLYEKSLPEGIDMPTVKKVYGHTEDLVAAMTLATGELAETAMKKNKKLDSVTADLKIARFGDINVGYQRSQERPKSITDRTMVTHYGTTTARIRTFGQKNKGELKKVRTMLSERGKELFS